MHSGYCLLSNERKRRQCFSPVCASADSKNQTLCSKIGMVLKDLCAQSEILTRFSESPFFVCNPRKSNDAIATLEEHMKWKQRDQKFADPGRRVHWLSYVGSEIQNPKAEIQRAKSNIKNWHKKNCYIMVQTPKSKFENPKSELQKPVKKFEFWILDWKI